MKHYKEFRCHNTSGMPHQIQEKSKRFPVTPDIDLTISNAEEYPDKAKSITYYVYIECVNCGRGAKVNQDGLVLARHNFF